MKYIFLRYARQPNQEVSAKLFSFTKETTRPNFTTLPGVMITEFEAKDEFTIDAIKAGFDSMNIKYDLIVKQEATTASPQAAAPVANNDLANLKRQLQTALSAENFEEASRLRDAIAAIEGPSASESVFYTSIQAFKESIKITENTHYCYEWKDDEGDTYSEDDIESLEQAQKEVRDHEKKGHKIVQTWKYVDNVYKGPFKY